ncbi:tetratricopeptide repeat protein [Acidisphaera sp. L21]|uniref:tetratricopeptide repeat protein n=1 Tax=Acidisphaera sp. L21 TaxID=1641851 RepID=UPI00131E2816|nr:tetratricopeptide repeat protein [Acidisphaera sp. L21]
MGVVIQGAEWGSRLELGAEGLRQRGPADPFVEAMNRTTDEADRLAIATRALRRDPDCIEANLVVAAACQDEELRLAYLNIAVEAGAALWGFVEDKCNLAAVHGARPWFQAIKALGDALAEAGDHSSAADCFDRLLKLDPGDRLDARTAQECLRDTRSHPKW